MVTNVLPPFYDLQCII